MAEPTLQALIDEFLSERRESDGGYAPVHKRDLNLLWRIVEALRTAKWGRDPDGDLPVEYHITDRTKYQRMHYWPVPYLHGDDLDDAEKVRRHRDALLINLRMALDSYSLYLRWSSGAAGEQCTSP